MQRTIRMAIILAAMIALAHIVASCVVQCAEIDKLWWEEDPPEVMEWARL